MSTIFTKDFWDDTGVKLWDHATKGNKVVTEVLPSWRVIYETMEKQEQPQAVANDSEQAADPPKAIYSLV